jgi:hypothetical protein
MVRALFSHRQKTVQNVLKNVAGMIRPRDGSDVLRAIRGDPLLPARGQVSLNFATITNLGSP